MTGAGGQLGRAVASRTSDMHAVVGKTRAQLDITNVDAVTQALAESNAQWLVNAAAYTAVDLAESDRETAKAVNTTAVGVLSAAAAAAKCRFLHVSTDFVFDGNSSSAYLPTADVKPLGVYGATKAAGEALAMAQGDSIIIRTSWVYAAQGKNFVLTMLRLMRERPEVRVVDDQIGSPTWAPGLATAVWACIDQATAGGIYHWTDLGVASWYDLAVAVQEEALARGLIKRAIPIISIPSTAYATAAERPSFSVLDTRSTRALLGLPGAHWRTNLRNMLDELRAS